MTQTDQKERTMPNAQTGERVSSIAGRLARLQPETLEVMAANPASRERLAKDIRSMAASLLAQDEHKGIRALFKKVLGK
jgi:TusA-related sulfurtransferase